MKKWLKIVLIIIGILVLSIGIDMLSIFAFNKPIFAIKDDCDCVDQVYKGLLYNTYNCFESSNPQIKAKWTEYSCDEMNKKPIIGKIEELTENYIIIKGVSDNNYLKYNDEAHISLSNNLTIKGANNLIVGQYLKLFPDIIQEVYPIIVYTKEVEIIYESDINY